ncbi:MAG: helix-turn-helix transcriptional regulator [Bacillota bacterium]|nr:helix-turn-helix transcriptional regulator [Priestia megaterium]
MHFQQRQWNLIRLRKERNLTQYDMKNLLNISKDAYGMKERGNAQFTMDEMFILSKYFDLPLEQIFLPRNFGVTEIKEVAK